MRSNPFPSPILTCLVAAAAVLACGLPGTAGPPAADPPAGSPILRDDFSNPASGWNTVSEDGLTLEYADGAFHIFVDNDAHTYIYRIAFLEGTYRDVRLEVDVQPAQGPGDASAYLICRRADAQNYVFADVDAEGQARVGVRTPDLQEILADETGVPGLHPGTVRLRLDCIGNTASLFVDGVLAASAEVEGPDEGGVGFSAGGSGAGKSDFRFDNFAVYAP
jgi:hypothetical protein